MITDSLYRLSRRFVRDESGNFMMMFGLGIAVIFMAAGLAFDYSISLTNKTRVNNALDAATLAAARGIAAGELSPDVDGQVETYLKAVFAANLGVDDLDASMFAIDSVTIDTDTQSVAATATIDQPLHFIKVATTKDSMDIGSESAVAYGVGNVEVAMVLDVTGSMDDPVSPTDSTKKLAALQEAAKLGVNELLSVNSASSENLRISIIPYAIGVNAGDDLAKYVYADHFNETSDAPVYNSSLYNSTGVGYDWANFQSGYASCPTSSYFDFQPEIRFAGGYGFGGGYSNGSSRENDGYAFGGAYVFQAKKKKKEKFYCWDFVVEYDGTSPDNCASDRKAPTTAGTSYQYRDENPSYGMISRDARLEENQCPDSEIITLSSNKTTLDSAIDGFSSGGWTAGHIGLQWGWYTISHDWASYLPSGSEPGDHTDPDEEIEKYIIMMTDGIFNTAYADVASDEFETGSQSSESYDHFDKLCTAIKNDDIKIFTIGFGLDNQTAKDELDDCATDDTAETTYYYDVDSSSELEETFEDIAKTIQRLRLTK
ncbi:MAG: pilus assembly protein [Hyphomicrobiales bacterium]|nr:pilus assembly protein [Hyphomicrobiales bacterium]